MQNPKLEADTGSRERNYKNVWEKLEKAKMTTVTFNYSKDAEPLAVVRRKAGADGQELAERQPCLSLPGILLSGCAGSAGDLRAPRKSEVGSWPPREPTGIHAALCPSSLSGSHLLEVLWVVTMSQSPVPVSAVGIEVINVNRPNNFKDIRGSSLV